jgi:hypothetical protein
VFYGFDGVGVTDLLIPTDSHGFPRIYGFTDSHGFEGKQGQGDKYGFERSALRTHRTLGIVSFLLVLFFLLLLLLLLLPSSYSSPFNAFLLLYLLCFGPGYWLAHLTILPLSAPPSPLYPPCVLPSPSLAIRPKSSKEEDSGIIYTTGNSSV